MRDDRQFRIGGISISLEGEVQKIDRQTLPLYLPFIGQGKRDINLRLHRGAFFNRAAKKVFECPPIWSLYRQNGISIFEIYHEHPGLERSLVFSNNIQEADLYFNDPHRPVDPFYGPTIELLTVSYLSQERGVIAHSCGIVKGRRGVLFIGESGAGKSTLARLWDQEDGIVVLSDDRTVLRRKGHQFWIYGTPWHGEAQFASPRTARLDRIIFLKHGRQNSAREIQGVEAASKFLSCSFPPLWDAAGMAFTLDFLKDLVTQIPCQELTFKPDRSAVKFVLDHFDNIPKNCIN